MKFPTNSNIIPLFENVTKAIHPFAESNGVAIQFASFTENLTVPYNPAYIIQEYSELLCNIIVFTPQNYHVAVRVKNVMDDEFLLKIELMNTGANLSRISEITSFLKNKYLILSPEPNTTLYELFIVPNHQTLTGRTGEYRINHHKIPPYFVEIRKKLQSHFSSIESMETAAIQKCQVHGVFLQKVNVLIQANLDREGFKTKDLCQGLALSRTQLYRKLNNLVNMSPARYILYYRLQKYRELLQDTNLNVGEVVARVGFASHSHFSRSFYKQFGINPS